MKSASPALLLILGAISAWVAPGSPNPHHFGQSEAAPNYGALLAAATPLQDSPEGRRVLQACIERYGGEERLRRLRSFRLSYSMLSMLAPDSVEMVKSFQRDRRYKVERPRETRWVSGDRAWRHSPQGTRVSDGWGYCAALFGYLTLAMPLAALEEPFDESRYGRRSRDPLEYLYFAKSDSLLIILGIDPETHLIEVSEGIIVRGDDPAVFVNRFGDHQDHDGYVFPHEVVNVAGGMEVGYSRLRSVELNVPLSESDFEPRGRQQPQDVH